MDLVKKFHALRIAEEKSKSQTSNKGGGGDASAKSLPSLSEIHELATDGKEHVDVTSGFLTIRKGDGMFVRKR